MASSHDAAVATVLSRLDGREPAVALVLGSGLGALAERIENPLIVSYDELPGFPVPTIEGHAGRLVIGDLGGCTVACMQGRMHLYEGHDPRDLAIPVRLLHGIGCRTLLLTNAAGSLHEDMPPGSLMMITDHINFTGISPLAGPNDAAVGPRFFDMTRAYDPELQALLRDAAAREGIDLHEGVYFFCLGPNFETPAEIRAIRVLGGDAVGMSTVPECLAAVHCGMRVAAVSTITNLAAGMTGNALSHAETLSESAEAASRLERLIRRFLAQLGGGE